MRKMIESLYRRAFETATVESLKGRSLSKVTIANLDALKARPCIAPDWAPRFVDVHSPLYRSTRRSHRFHGEVAIDVTGCPRLAMLCHDDDMVAYTYFFFGSDSYESLSVLLFAAFSTGAEAVLDIGAYTGLFGLVAARAEPAAQVAGFEPLPHIAERARLNSDLNGLTNFTVVSGAVGAEAGAGALTLYGVNAATTGASLATKDRSDIGSLTVDVTTIDDYAATLGGRRVRLMKLDTEGAEVAAMAGGARVLGQDGPVVLSEVLNDNAVAAQTAEMAKWGYSAWFVNERNRKLIPVGPRFSLARRRYGNLLFMKTEEDAARAQSIAASFRKVWVKPVWKPRPAAAAASAGNGGR